jgi:hypothetical protein
MSRRKTQLVPVGSIAKHEYLLPSLIDAFENVRGRLGPGELIDIMIPSDLGQALEDYLFEKDSGHEKK